jgi:flavin-dependent dehydrogenase
VEEGVLVDAPLLESGDRLVVAGVVVKGRDGRAIPLRARVVIAADGRSSRITRALGLSSVPSHPRRWAVGAYFSDVTGLTSCGEMHIRCGRYLGVAPMPDGTANACVVTTDRAALADPGALLWSAFQADPILGERFASARQLTRPVTIGPLAVDCRVAGAPGLLLAGDACGFVDPMTGDGLRFAFRGGELAAEAALHAIEHGTGDAHLRLARARAREFGRKWQFNRTLRALVGSTAAVRAAGWGATLLPRVLHEIIAYAGDVRAA